MNHIDLSQFISYQNSKLTPKEHQKIREHIETCSVCQENLKEYERFLVLFNQSYQRPHSNDSAQCYTDFELLNYIRGKPSQKRRTKIWGHMLECQTCMDKMLSLSRDFDELLEEGVLKTHQSIWEKPRRFISQVGVGMIEKIQIVWGIPRSFRPAYRWVGLVLFLCISMIAVIAINTSDKTPMVTRDNQLDIGQKEVLLIHPANKSELDIHKSEFQWQEPLNTVASKFLLLDDRGNIIWETSTKDKRLELPDNIVLNEDRLYFWRVEALLKDGTSRLSPMASFRNILE